MNNTTQDICHCGQMKQPLFKVDDMLFCDNPDCTPGYSQPQSAVKSEDGGVMYGVKPQTSEGWEDEFDKKFTVLNEKMDKTLLCDFDKQETLDIYEPVKAFIRNLIAEEQKSLLEGVRQLKEKAKKYPMMLVDARGATTHGEDKYWNEGYDKALDDVLDQLKAHLTTGGGIDEIKD